LILYARNEISFINKLDFADKGVFSFKKGQVSKLELRNTGVFVAQSYFLFEIHKYIKCDV